SLDVAAQKITYSEPDDNDGRNLSAYEVIGRLGQNILIYKNYKDDHYISVYDQHMKQVGRNKLGQIPERMINADFMNFSDMAIMIYQYQKKSVVYCMALRIDASGKPVGEPVEMDTTHINFWASNRVYNTIFSEDKKRIGVFKLNTKNDKVHVLTSAVFDDSLKLMGKHRVNLKMPNRYDYLTEFTIDNDGDIAFLRVSSSGQNDNINKLQLLVKPVDADAVAEYDLDSKGLFLDDVRVRADNGSRRFLITSFFTRTRRGNVEGIYSYIWDKRNAMAIAANSIAFTDELRADAKGGNNAFKTAFDDYFLRNIIMREDGGFLLTAESIYSTSRGGAPLSRWDYIYGSPYAGEFVPIGVNPYYYPWWRTRGLGQTTRYFADNVLILSFDEKGALEWTNVVRKSQFDDNTDNFLGYTMMNTGSELHFLYNLQEKRNLMLTDQSIEPSGQLTRRPTLKNLDKGYDFMPRYGKQIAAKTIIFPCQYRNYICFAKVDFN
ncbi:MAG TPA: hypothetical protein VF145_07895, partial [Chitinophagaceae bacterium]